MAERGAHLSQLLLDSSRPSIFELVAQEGLNQALRGTVKFVFRVFANHNPQLFGGMLRWADEIQLLFDCLLQNHYLRNYGASFSENFYGLERVSKDDKTLNKDEYTKSFLSLTALPYILSKIENIISQRREGATLSYSWIKFFYDIIVLINWVLYTWGKSLAHSPILHILGIKLRHGEQEAATGLTLPRIVELGAFFVQFLDWWFTSQTTQAKSLLALPIPPAPHTELQNKNPHIEKGICPICRRKLQNECVLQVSGYVFCYRCISQHLQNNSTCPVSKVPAKAGNLIRIFANTE